MYLRMNDTNMVKEPTPGTRITKYGAAKPPPFDSPRSARFLNSITYQSSVLWANLPNNVKRLDDRDKFNREVTKIVWAEFSA